MDAKKKDLQVLPCALACTVTHFFSFLKLGIVCVSCFVQVTNILFLCKHGSQRVVIHHFLTFLTPSLRILSFLSLFSLLIPALALFLLSTFPLL